MIRLCIQVWPSALALLGMGAANALALSQAPLGERQNMFLDDWLPHYFESLDQPPEQAVSTMLEGLLFLGLPQYRNTENGHLWLEELQRQIIKTPRYADIMGNMVQAAPRAFGLRTPVAASQPCDHVLVLHAAGYLPAPETVRLLGNTLDDMRMLRTDAPPCDLVPPAFFAACALSRLRIEGAPDEGKPYYMRLDARDVVMGAPEYSHIAEWKEWWEHHRESVDEIRFRESPRPAIWNEHPPVMGPASRKRLKDQWISNQQVLRERKEGLEEAERKAQRDLEILAVSKVRENPKVTSLPWPILAIVAGCLTLIVGAMWLDRRRRRKW